MTSQTTEDMCSTREEAVSLFRQKLLNQDGQEQLLLDAYQRLKSPEGSKKQEELVLLSGQSGRDRVTMVTSTLQPLVERDGGCFLSGRFQENCYSGPYSVFVSVFTEFAEIVSSKCPAKLESLRKDIDMALGEEDLYLLMNMIPAMEKVIGKPSSDHAHAHRTHGPSTTAQNRFRFLFCRFCRAVFTKSTPLVLFLDDLPYANPASLQLMDVLLTQGNPNSILLIAGYKASPGETTRTGNFGKAVEKWKAESHTDITEIQMVPLCADMMYPAVSDVFRLEPKKSQDMADLILEQSNGRYTDGMHFVKFLLDEGHLLFNERTEKWVCDERRRSFSSFAPLRGGSNRNLNCSSSMDIFREKITQLPEFTQQLLKVSACMGEVVDEMELGLVLEESEKVKEALETAKEEDIMEFNPRFGWYRFKDGCCQQAAYSLIPTDKRQEFKLWIGRKLWNMSSPKALEKNLFLIVNLLNEGKTIMDYQPEKYRLAELNLKAAEKAVGLSAFVDAEKYLTVGIGLLDKNRWKQKYTLTLELYHAAAEVAVVTASFERVEVLIKEVFQHAHTMEDKMRSYLTLIVSLGQQDDVHQAEMIGFDLLEELGERFPPKATNFYLALDLLRTKRMLRGKSNDRLLKLPEMTNETKVTAMIVMNTMIPYLFMSKSRYLPLIAFRFVRLSLKHGLYPGSSIGFAIYGSVLSSVLGKAREGYRFGELALSLLERSPAHRECLPRVYTLVHGCITHWVTNIAESLEPLKQASQVAMKMGDVEIGLLSACQRSYRCYYRGVSLPVLGKECESLFKQLGDHRQENLLLSIRPLIQTIRNLTGSSKNTRILSGDVLNHDLALKEAKETNNKTAANIVLVFAMDIAYLFGDFKRASEFAMQAEEFEDKESHSFYGNAVADWHRGLFAVAVMLERSPCNTKKSIKTAKRNLAKTTKWARDCPANFLHKQHLLEAEIASFKGRHESAEQKYDLAIQGAIKEGFIQEAALACERAAQHLKRMDKEESASRYLCRARSLYIEWGATAKAAQLEASIEKS